MSKNRQFDKSLFCLIFILVLLIVNLAYSLHDKIDYQKRVESGNDRWYQVANIIYSIEYRVNVLEEEFYNGGNSTNVD